MNILITGFEPFGSWKRNPSGEVARRLNGLTIADSVDLAAVKVRGLVLPVSFQRVAAPLIATIEEFRPEIVLHLGQGSGGRINVERIGINRGEGRDNDEYNPEGAPLVEGGPPTYRSRMPIEEMVNGLSQMPVPVQASDSAGTYLCNCVLYTTLHYSASHPLPLYAGFLHAPPLSEEASSSSAGEGLSLEAWTDMTLKAIDILRPLYGTIPI